MGMFEVGSFRASTCQGVSRRAFLSAGVTAPFALAASAEAHSNASRSPEGQVDPAGLAGRRAEPPRSLRPQAQGPRRIPRPVHDDRHPHSRRSIHRAAAEAGGPIAQVFADSKQREFSRWPSRGRLDRLDRCERSRRRFTRPTSARSSLASAGMTHCLGSSHWPVARSATASARSRAPAAAPGARGTTLS